MSSTEDPAVGPSTNLLYSEEISESELTRVLKLKNAQSASLVLMLLCDDILDLRQMEVKSDNEMFESRLKAVRNITGHASRTDIVRAARNFGDTFFTKGDAISFLHPKLYYACACAVFRMKPYFLLENCSLRLLYERVQSLTLHSAALKDDHQTIYVSKKQFHVIARRLAEAIKAGNYSMSLSHPILKEDFMVEKVFQELTKRRRNVQITKDNKMSKFIYRTDRGTYLLQWAIRAHNLNLVKKIVSVGHVFSKREIIKGFYTCSSCGNVQVMQYLLEEHESVIEPVDLKIAFHSAIDNCYIQIVYVLMRYGALNLDLSSDRQQKLFHMSAKQEDSELCEAILSHVLRNCPIGHTVSMVFRKKETNRFRNICSEVLHISCKAGHLLSAKFVIPFSDINNHDEYGRTPLINAALKGRLEVFCLLVSRGADLTLIDNFGDSALHLACWGGNQSIVRNLLPSFDINSCGQRGWTPLMHAAICGNKEAFDLLVSKKADLTLTDNNGDTVYHLACEGGNASIVECLLPSFDIDVRGMYLRTPIMVAADNRKKEVFDMLLANKADLTITDIDGDTVFHLACAGGNVEIVKNTMSLFNINMRGEFGLTPLMKAVGEGHIDVFDLLLENANVTLKDDCGDSLLHLACEEGNVGMVKHVMPYSDVNLRNNLGWTPAMVALVFGQSNVFQYLVVEGADLTLVDSVGNDVLTLAYYGGCSEVIKELSPAGEDIKVIKKWTELMRFLVYGLFTMHTVQQGSPELIQRDGFGDTLLHLACRGGNIRCVEHLLPCYDINVRGRYGWTPVMMAARCGHVDVFRYLVSHQADTSLVSDTGEDVVSLAQRATRSDIVALLTSNKFPNRD